MQMEYQYSLLARNFITYYLILKQLYIYTHTHMRARAHAHTHKRTQTRKRRFGG